MPKKLPPLKKTKTSMPMTEDEVREARWRAEADADTLARAAEIRADKTRIGFATQVANERIAQLKRVAKGK